MTQAIFFVPISFEAGLNMSKKVFINKGISVQRHNELIFFWKTPFSEGGIYGCAFT